MGGCCVKYHTARIRVNNFGFKNIKINVGKQASFGGLGNKSNPGLLGQVVFLLHHNFLIFSHTDTNCGDCGEPNNESRQEEKIIYFVQ